MTRSPLQKPGSARSALVAVALLLVAGCSSATTTPTAAPPPEAAQPVVAGGKVIVLADTEPAGFNNRTAKGNTTAVRNIMRRVWPSVWTVTPNFENVLDPNFVVRAEVTSVAPQTIVYEINKDARWSDPDKTPISANDFIYNWEVGKAGAFDIDGSAISSVAPGENAIESITGSPDGKTVTVVLRQPMAEWKSLFTKPLVPAHVAKRVGWNKGFDDWTAVVSGGPFRIGSYNAGRDLTLVRNELYSGKPANLDSVTFNFVKDSSVALTEMRNNSRDSRVPPQVIAPRAQIDVLDQLQGEPGITMQVGTGFEAEFLDFYVGEKATFLKDRRVRQAFALALDRQAIVARSAGQINRDAGVMQHRLLPAGAPFADTSPKGYDRRDIVKAKAVLVEAGFVMPPGEDYFKKDGETLELRITAATGDALRLAQEEFIQSQVKDAGIKLKIENAPSDNTLDGLSSRLNNGNFDVASLSQGMATNPTTTSASFATRGPGKPGTANISMYSNETVDGLYAQAASTIDEKSRVELLNQIDRLLWEDMPRLPLYQRPTIVAFSNSLANVGINPVSGPFWNIDQWGMKATPRAR